MAPFNRENEKGVIDEELREFIKRKVIEYMKRSSPGIYVSLNKYYILLFGKNFVDVFIEKPGKCYQTLTKFFNNHDSAEFFIHCILEHLLTSNPFYVAPAIIALKEKNDDEFKRILVHALSRERRRMTIS